MNYKKTFANVVSCCIPFPTARRALRTRLCHAVGLSARVSYSQHGQDLLVREMFNTLGVEKPTYIDLGAHHPYEISNTAIFYAAGSRGINVEADPELMGAFRRMRSGDVNLCVGCGTEAGTLPYYVLYRGCDCNGFDRKRIDAFIAAHPKYSVTRTKMIPMITLASIIEEHAGGKFPDFLDMDIEGMDYDIVRSFDLSKNGPKIAIIEAANSKRIRNLMQEYGYFIYCRLGQDLIFARNEYRERLY